MSLYRSLCDEFVDQFVLCWPYETLEKNLSVNLSVKSFSAALSRNPAMVADLVTLLEEEVE